MPAPWRHGVQDRVEYVVVERDGVHGEGQAAGVEIENPTPTLGRILQRSYTRRQMPISTDIDDDSDDEDESTTTTRRLFTIPSATPSGPPAVRFLQKAQQNTRD